MLPEGTLSQRLTGLALPDVVLKATDGKDVSLAQTKGCAVVYVYPRTSPQNGSTIPGWEVVPGAKGCTPQSCGFRDLHQELLDAGADVVFGLSVQDNDYQSEARRRLKLPFQVLSDAKYQLQTALDLPTIEVGGMILLERFAMVIDDGVISSVFHPVSNPSENANDILGYLKSCG